MPRHPHIRRRQPAISAANRVIVFAPEPELAQWIDDELVSEPLAVQIARTIVGVISALVEDPPPRPQILIADFDAMTAADLLHLHKIRDRGWFGSLIALGGVPDELCNTLNIHQVLKGPFTSGELRRAVTAVGLGRPTTKLTKLEP
jgi:hypothetical protein